MIHLIRIFRSNHRAFSSTAYTLSSRGGYTSGNVFKNAIRRLSSTTDTTSTPVTENENPSNGVFDKIAFIGTGMMAQAVLEPMIAQKIQPASKVMIYDVNVTSMQKVSDAHGVQCAGNMEELIYGSDLIICAVKPQNLTPGFFQEVYKGTTNSNKEGIFLSVIAGKGMQVFEQGGFKKIVRSMPNTPATIGQGMTVWSATPNLSVDERKKIRQVLNCCGNTVRCSCVLKS